MCNIETERYAKGFTRWSGGYKTSTCRVAEPAEDSDSPRQELKSDYHEHPRATLHHVETSGRYVPDWTRGLHRRVRCCWKAAFRWACWVCWTPCVALPILSARINDIANYTEKDSSSYIFDTFPDLQLGLLYDRTDVFLFRSSLPARPAKQSKCSDVHPRFCSLFRAFCGITSYRRYNLFLEMCMNTCGVCYLNSI